MKNNRFGQAKVLDTQELDLIINYLPSNYHKFLARTLRNTGARIGEVVQLKWRDFGEDQILFPATITKRKLKSREIFISTSFYKWIKDFKLDWQIYKGRKPNPEDYVFYDKAIGANVTDKNSSLVVGPGQNLTVYSSAGDLSYVVTGFESPSGDFDVVNMTKTQAGG